MIINKHKYNIFQRITTIITAITTLALTLSVASNASAHNVWAPKAQSDVIAIRLDLATGAKIEDISAMYGTEVQHTFIELSGAYLVRALSGGDINKLVKEIAKDPHVLYAEIDAPSATPEADPINIKAWGLDATPYVRQDVTRLLQLDRAHQISQGDGIVVAIIDTGIQLDHPALAPYLSPIRHDFLDDDAIPDDSANKLDDDGDGMIDEAAGHGTHIAGIIHLVAPKARIMPLRVLDSDGNGYLFQVVEAIAYAVNHGANVINLSLGIKVKSRILSDAVQYATEHGVVVVAAAGNLADSNAQYPAADDCAVGVNSVGANDILSTFSSYGKWVDFAAPGEAIYSTFIGGGYATWSGTSMATPFVAGQAALLQSLDPTLSAREIAGVIERTGTH